MPQTQQASRNITLRILGLAYDCLQAFYYFPRAQATRYLSKTSARGDVLQKLRPM